MFLLIEGKCKIQHLGIRYLSANFLDHESMILICMTLSFVIGIGIESEYSGTDVFLLIQDFVPYNFFKIKITSILETTVGVPG